MHHKEKLGRKKHINNHFHFYFQIKNMIFKEEISDMSQCIYSPTRQIRKFFLVSFSSFKRHILELSSSDGKASAYNEGDPGLIPGLGRSPGEGNGSPLQYSCLENPMGGGDWRATVHGVTKSRTRLSNFTFTCGWFKGCARYHNSKQGLHFSADLRTQFSSVALL